MDLAERLTLTLYEAEALARSAARGARLPWGMAEEAGRAVRALEVAGLPGLDALALRLTFAGPCPLALGCAISDGAAPPQEADLAAPILLLPFLPDGTGLRWEGGEAASAGGLRGSGALLAPRARLRVEHAVRPGAVLCRDRAHGSGWALRRLGALAARTRAPASEASRRGAG